MAERPLTIGWMGHHSRSRGDGVITYSRELTSGLRRRGHRVVFFHHQPEGKGGSNLRTRREQDSVRLGSIANNRLYVISSPRSRREIADILQAEKVDVVHVSLAFASVDFSLPELCHELGIPIVGTLHIPFDTRLSLWSAFSRVFYTVYAPTLADYDRVVIFSEPQRELLGGFGVPDEVIRVIPNGIDVDRYSPGESGLKARLGADTVFTFLGRLDPEKNVDYLLRAWSDIDPPDNVHLVIVGTGSERLRLARRFKGPRIHFTGLITNENERIDVLRGSDAFFLPSSVEGLSLAMLEAMACGVATVATDVGSDGDALREAGLVLDLKDAEGQLRLAMRTLLEFPDYRRELGARARQRAVERFSLARNIDAVVDMYHEVVRKPAIRS
ncbi:MAG: glycosyltransferase family 4 protein [Candidatus Dormibacteria bacterium]